MSENDSLSHRPRLRFWGWGNADEHLTPGEEAHLVEIAKGVSGEGFTPTPTPSVEEFDLPEARVRATTARRHRWRPRGPFPPVHMPLSLSFSSRLQEDNMLAILWGRR